MHHSSRRATLWTFLVTSAALVMVTLDNLVVTTALPVIKRELNASLESLEWTVNAYTLTFAVFLLTGAALGDRFGRRRMFLAGIAIFTFASIGAALAPNVEFLVAARAVQGLGGALVTPLTLTLLSAAVPAEKRALALGAWGGIGGLAVALGPLVGGAIVEGWAWQWIFWINVPIGLILLPIAWSKVRESHGPNERLDLAGVVLASFGLFGVVWGLVRGQGQGWLSGEILSALTVGTMLVGAFIAWERRARAPMLPLRFFRSRTFALTNLASFAMYFGMFGAVFLLAQFFQVAQGDSPLTSGLKILPWTAMPVVVAPIAGALSGRVVSGPKLVAFGLALQSAGLFWLVAVMNAGVGYGSLVMPFVLSGMGMGLFFAPVANVIMSSVRPIEEGQASGANNAIRELGGVFGVAVLASVFASNGGYQTPQIFSDGLRPATLVGAIVVGLGALVAFAVPGSHPPLHEGSSEPLLASEVA